MLGTVKSRNNSEKVWYSVKLKKQGCDNYMKLKIFSVILVAVVLTACSEDDASKGNFSPENETQNIKELVSDYSTGNLKAESASITSQQLMVNDSNGKNLRFQCFVNYHIALHIFN